ncbi:hypothetical protein PCANC_23652 [Puccinia coronata f. sp. avenae]|uniref:Cdc37 C-terminal domain-containing protein n=1 Tax=Puccinia coronata f. sp. avenae TaxID=200324 RepID=A0A2N5UGG6_9BASI|nr:hypothetical protein PCANC_23652 [Puccinia coronata f. sp. avenae]PLW36841.1 hypothetical protein PCASD_15285 [Puccinia coronata f. sp. avenae]
MEDGWTSLGGRWNTFVQLPETLQKALQAKQLHHLDRVIGGLDIPEAEEIFHALEQAGLLCFQL